MAKPKKNLTPRYQPWVDARQRFRLSHAHIQMARELGMNPKKLGGIRHAESGYDGLLAMGWDRREARAEVRSRVSSVLSRGQ